MNTFSKKISSIQSNQILFVLLIMQPFLDIISFFAVKNGLTLFTTVLRMFIFAVVTIYSFWISDNKKLYYVMGGILCMYWILHMLGCFMKGYQSLYQDTAMYLRTIQMPVLAVAFITLLKKNRNYNGEIEKSFFINYIVITVSILISFLVGIPEYTYYGNIGIKGWFSVGNSQSCIISVMAPLGLCYAYRTQRKVMFFLTLGMEVLNMYFFGTRVAFFSIFIVCISFGIFLIWNRKKEFYTYLLLILAMLICAIAYKYSPCYVNQFKSNNSFSEWDAEIAEIKINHMEGIDKENEKYEREIYLETYNLYCKDLVEKYGLEKVVEKYNYSTDASDVISNRKLKINYSSLNMDEQGIWTHLFGYEYLDYIYNGTIYDPENDFPALYFSYGYVGLVLYIIFILYFVMISLKYVLNNWRKISIEIGTIGTALVLMLGVAQYSGNVLRRPNVSIYLSVMLAYMYYLCKSEEMISEENSN